MLEHTYTCDVAIVGGGIGGLMTAYSLNKQNRFLKIVILDKGNFIDHRVCPASKSKECQHCDNCSITTGFGGAGAFSDGKFNAGTAYGGTLADELGERTANEYIQKSLDILDSYASRILRNGIQTYGTDYGLRRRCSQNNLTLVDMNTVHFGTENIRHIMTNLIKEMGGKGVEMHDHVLIEDIEKRDDNYVLTTAFGNVYNARKVVLATGRSGSYLVSKVCKKYKIATETNAVDIGVRVETLDDIWSEFSSRIYEPKILYRTKTFEDMCRMFCFNQGGYVSAENNDGIITANGHSYAHEKKSNNCNFAILSSIKFTEPFDKPTEYVKNYSRMANVVGDGNIIVQRFGDLVRGRRTTQRRLDRSSIRPTLKATPGDLSLVLPYRILTNIIETIYALDRVAPGTANDDTLLYGCEAKYYSLKPQHTCVFSILDGMYLIGDGSGISRGLSQAAAMGLYVADMLGAAFGGNSCESKRN